MELIIDAGFKSLIPPLSSEERSQLEANILSDGCRDPLVVWPHPYEGVPEEDWPRLLIDGHNRYQICKQHGIPFETVDINLADRNAAEDWIDANQLGRRNLDARQMSLLRGRRYNRTKKQGERSDITSGQNVQKLTTAETLAAEHGVNEKTIRRDGKFAEAVGALGMDEEVASGAIDANREAIIDAAKPILDATKAHKEWEEEVKQRPLAAPPEPPKPTEDDIRKAKAHVSHNSGQNEWYTPAEFIDAATAAFNGIIDCDPASSEIANQTVNASTFCTKEQDGLSKRWFGNVWMNPPYAQPLISQFCEALAQRYEDGEIAAAIVLVNNGTETSWFQRLAGVASAICFPRTRIKFIDANGDPRGAPLQGQAILYAGDEPKRFVEEFQKFGFCVVVLNPATDG